jgi:hypothetical protein
MDLLHWRRYAEAGWTEGVVPAMMIISGAGSGTERGALRAAIDLNIDYGGWRCADDYVPGIYGNRMRLAKSRAWQRRLNVQDSDATLFIMRRGSMEIKFIVDACRTMRKPAKTLILNDRISSSVRDSMIQWIMDRRIEVLNVTGDEDEEFTRDALVDLFEDR